VAIKIGRYNQSQVESRALRAPAFDTRAPDGAFGENVAGALNQAAGVLANVRQHERDLADASAVIEADNALDGWENQNILDGEQGALTKRGKDAFDLPNQVLPAFDAEAKKLEDGITGQRAKLQFRQASNRRRSQIESVLNRHESAQRGQFYDEQDVSKIASSSEMAANYYNDPVRIGEELGKQDSVVDNMGRRKGWSAEQIANEKRKLHSNVHSDVVSRYIARGEIRKGQIYFEEVKDQISADAGTRIEAQFRAERERVKTESKQAMNDQLRDISAAAANGLPVTIPSQVELKAIYGEHEGGQRYKIALQAQQLSPKVAQMKLMPQAELQAFVASQQPSQQEGAADQQAIANDLEVMAGQILAARARDPAAYVAQNNPKVGAALEAFEEDPSPEAADAFARTSLSAQAALGIAKPKLLTDSQVITIGERLTPKGNGEGTVRDIQSERARWGKHWDRVLSEAGPKLPPAVKVIAAGMDSVPAAKLATVATMSQEDYGKLLPDSIKESAVRKDVRAQLQSFIGSTLGWAGAEETSAMFIDQTTKLASAYIAGGLSRSDAARRAADEVVLSRYKFVRWGGADLRLPKDVDEDLIVRGLRARSAAVLREHGIDSDDVRWWTLPDDSGVVLKDAATGRALAKPDGTPLGRFTYLELQQTAVNDKEARRLEPLSFEPL
jgi:hypothetical protein